MHQELYQKILLAFPAEAGWGVEKVEVPEGEQHIELVIKWKNSGEAYVRIMMGTEDDKLWFALYHVVQGCGQIIVADQKAAPGWAIIEVTECDKVLEHILITAANYRAMVSGIRQGLADQISKLA